MRPIITGGLQNQTVLVNTTVTFQCDLISDLEAHIQWAKVHIQNDSDISLSNITKFEVYPILLSGFW